MELKNMLIVLAFSLLFLNPATAITCDSGTLDTTCIISTSQTVNGTITGAGNLGINSGAVLNIQPGSYAPGTPSNPTTSSYLIIDMGGSVNIQGTIYGEGLPYTTISNMGKYAGSGPEINISAGSIFVSGSVQSIGGYGIARNMGNSPAPYGADGGKIRLSAGSVTISGSVTSAGGDGGANVGTGHGGPGGNGDMVLISADKTMLSGNITSKGGAGANSNTASGGKGGNGGPINISSGSFVVSGAMASQGNIGGIGPAANGLTGSIGEVSVVYDQFYSGPSAYLPKMRIYLGLKNASLSPIPNVNLTLYQEDTNVSAKCSGVTDTGGWFVCYIQTSSISNFDIYALGDSPKNAKLTLNKESDNMMDAYITGGYRKIADLRRFKINLKDAFGAGVDSGKLTVKDQNGDTVCATRTIKFNSTLDGDAYCRVISASYLLAGKSIARYDLSVDTNNAYQDAVQFNDYLPRDSTIYIGSVHKYLPKHASLADDEKMPVEIRYFPSETSQDFIFNDTIPAGFSFSGAVSIIKHTTSGAQSCSYTPSDTKFSVGSAQCAMLSASIIPGGWFELAYNTTVPSGSTQTYTIPAGTVSYLS